MKQSNATDTRIRFMFRRATSRQPEQSELTILRNRHAKALTKYRANKAATKALVGNFNAEHAAWTVVASVILNLDETITRE